MSRLDEMKQLTNLLYGLIKGEKFEDFDLQSIISRMEKAFNDLASEEGFDPNHKDAMIISLEKYSKNQLKELENKIQSKNSISYVQEQTKFIYDKIQEFWKEEGFNYISNFSITNSGIIEIDFGFSFDYGAVLTNKKVSQAEKNKQTKERLKKEGYVFNNKENDLIDCDLNKEKIKEVILNRFPSAYLYSWETFIGNPNTQMHILRNLKVRIREISDVFITIDATVNLK